MQILAALAQDPILRRRANSFPYWALEKLAQPLLYSAPRSCHYINPSPAKMHSPRTLLRTVSGVAATIALGACGDSTGVDGPRQVSLSFQVGSSTSLAAVSMVTPPADGPQRVAGPPLTLEGTNGTLQIDEIRVIVAEVELDGEDDACEDGTPSTDDCADFEAPPRFLDLPLDGQPVAAFTSLVPAGTYDELEFEIEDLEDDEEDTEFAAEIAALREAILDEFPDWPREATALVVGSFTSPTETTSFRVYLEAEIEVERDLVPPLVVADDGSDGIDLTVDIRPDIWFGSSDGTVLDLSQYDYDATGQLLEFEVEMEDGIVEIEIER